MTDGATPADPEAARREILARIADPEAGSPLTVPTARIDPGPALPAVAGSTADPPATGPARPDAGERALARVGIPAAVLSGVAVCALVAVLIAILVGWTGVVPTVLALLLAVGAAAGAGIAVQAGILGARHGAATGERVSLHWESGRPWIGRLGASPERRLVDMACRAAERIAGCPAWWAPELDDHRLTVDLAAELDQIDGQAYALAQRGSGRAAVGPASGPATGPATESATGSATEPATARTDPEWEALLDHVAALVDYADRLQRYAAGQAPESIVTADSRRQLPPPFDAGAAAAGAARDEFATDHLRRLSGDLNSRTDPPADR